MMFNVKLFECLSLIFMFLIFIVNCEQLENKIFVNKFKYEIEKNFTLPEGPVYAKGWLKYTSFSKEDLNKPKEFNKNKAFYIQMKGVTLDLSKSDNVGYINIPNDEHFFFLLTEKNLNVLTSRKNNLVTTVDTLNIEDILKYDLSQQATQTTTPKEDSNSFSGEILDHGDFAEGYCFQIKSLHWKKKSEFIWEFCADSRKEKIMWMNTIYFLLKKFKNSLSNNNLKNLAIDPKINLSEDAKKKNVTWVPITKWTECSKPCDGGKSYLQRLCIIPEDTSEKCEGEMILERSCNLDPCETFDTEIAKYNMTRAQALSQINNIPLSKRPMRYEKCKIKEGDLALYIDEGTIKGAKIPVRVIVNKNTLTAYANDNFDSIILSHRLSTITGLRKYDKDDSNGCFEIEENKRKTILCAFSADENKGIVELAKEWQIDILEFIKKCTDSYSPNLDYKEIDVDKNTENTQNFLDFYQEKEKDEMERIIQKTQQVALQALEKEIKVENLIEKEQELKQKKTQEEYIQKLEQVRLQKELISKALMEKKKQADVYANKLTIKKKIKQISEQVKREVFKIREDLRARLIAKQRDESRKTELVMNRINDLKKDISNELLKASKDGKIEECNPERKNEEIINYCKVNYSDDFTKMNECVQSDKFCYMCCECEFGDLHLEKRSNCYSKCDDYYIFDRKLNDNSDKNDYKEEITLNNPKNQDITKENRETSNDSKNLKAEKKENKKNLIKKNSKNNNKKNNKAKNVKTSDLNLIQTDEIEVDDNKQDIDKLIEEAKKKELLMNIKEELI